MALPDRLPVMLAPARAMVDAVSLRLSLMAPRRSMWLPLALRLPVNPPTLPSPILGLFLVSATDVVSGRDDIVKKTNAAELVQVCLIKNT